MNVSGLMPNMSNSVRPLAKETTETITAATFTCLLILFALVANTFVCFATLRHESNRPLTNYFIFNLCIADIMIAVISMPVWVLFQLYGAQGLHTLLGLKFLFFWGSVDVLCGTASILSLSCISVDKYLAITRPLTYMRCMTWKRAFVMIFAVWCYAGTVAFLRQPMQERGTLYALFVLIASFILPLIVIVLSYAKIFFVARKHSRDMARRSSLSHDEKYKRVSRDLKAAKTISVVIGTFVLCWAPFIVVSVCYAYGVQVHNTVGNISKWMAYLNAILNPLVYSCVDKRLRGLVCKILFCPRRNDEVRMPLRTLTRDTTCST